MRNMVGKKKCCTLVLEKKILEKPYCKKMEMIRKIVEERSNNTDSLKSMGDLLK
uniref:Uncharacterized protein n=1 Tax=Octopus bimaculoides TaxID=37653 RepID=A0A0L8HYB3_OCTBM